MNGALWVLLLSGVLGFRVGMLGFPDWQVAVETAQVVAGLVTYPARQHFLHLSHALVDGAASDPRDRACARASSEITLSLIISGVQGMLTFQALALFVYALSRDVLLAIGAAALIFFTRTAEYGTVYPLFLLGTEHTYGVIGLSTAALVVAMLGAGWYRTGAFLLGVAPCIHPALGSWTGLAVGLAVLSDFRNLRVELRPALPWFVSGCGITLVSLLIQFGLAPAMPATMTRLDARRSFNVHQAVGWTSRCRESLVDWGTAERRSGHHRLHLARILFGRASELVTAALAHHRRRSLLALAMVPLSWIPPEASIGAPRLDAGPLLELRCADLRGVAHRTSRQLPRGLESPGAAVPFVRPARQQSQHALGVSRAPSQRPLSDRRRPLRIVWLSAAAALASAIWERSQSSPQRTWRGAAAPPAPLAPPVRQPLAPLAPLAPLRT